jgi:hypothetical protein
MSKHIKTRIVNKHALEAEWVSSADFVPLKGELIVYDAEVDAAGNTLELPEGRTVPYTYERVKLGDGFTPINRLPFISGSIYIGSGDMPDGYDIQIDPDGEITEIINGKSAYEYAREGGYTGTEAEFTQLLGNIATIDGRINSHNSNASAHSDIRSSLSSLSAEITSLKSSIVTVHSGTEAAMTSSVGSDGDVYLVTE